MAKKTHFISAVGTPLTEAGGLHAAGLEAHLTDQWMNGIGGVLVAGTMGMMQLLTDETYRKLALRAGEFSKGRGEVMVGAGDCSFHRTRDRVEYLNDLKIDGIVVLTPFFIQFSQAELIQYYRAVADECKKPLYLYDLPQRTHSKIEIETVLELAKHPNIRGIKCSDEPSYARRIIDALGDGFRVIVAQPTLVDVFLKFGIAEHLDGMFALAPAWTANIGRRAEAGDWAGALAAQQKLTALLSILIQYGVMPAFSALLNLRGMGGNFAPLPYAPLADADRERLAAEPVVRDFLFSAGGDAG